MAKLNNNLDPKLIIIYVTLKFNINYEGTFHFPCTEKRQPLY